MATGISSLTLLTDSLPAPRFAGPIPNPAKLLLYQRHQQDRNKFKNGFIKGTNNQHVQNKIKKDTFPSAQDLQQRQGTQDRLQLRLWNQRLFHESPSRRGRLTEWTMYSCCFITNTCPSHGSRYRHKYKIQTLPKAQRTRGLSSVYQSNFFRLYHQFFKISTKHQHFDKTKSYKFDQTLLQNLDQEWTS